MAFLSIWNKTRSILSRALVILLLSMSLARATEEQALNQSINLRLTQLFFRTIFQEYMREGLTEKRPNFLVHRYYIETFLQHWDQELESNSALSTREIWQKILNKKRNEYLGSSYQIWQRSLLFLFEKSDPNAFKLFKPHQIQIGYYRQTFLAQVLNSESEKNLEVRVLRLLDDVRFTLMSAQEDVELGLSLARPFLRYPENRVSRKALDIIDNGAAVHRWINGTKTVLGLVGLKSVFSALFRQPGRVSEFMYSGVTSLSKLSGAAQARALQRVQKIPKLKEFYSLVGHAAKKHAASMASIGMHGGLLYALWPKNHGDRQKDVTAAELETRAATKFEVLTDLAIQSQRTEGLLESSLLLGALNPQIHNEMTLNRTGLIQKLEGIVRQRQRDGNVGYSLFPLMVAFENALGMLPSEKELFYRLANRRIQALRTRVSKLPDGDFESLRQILMNEDLFNYIKESNDVNSVISGWGGNCVSQTLVMLSLLKEFPKLLPSDRKLKVIWFLDHVELAFESESTWQILIHGNKYGRDTKISVFEPEIILEEMIRILKATPEGAVLQSNPLASPKLSIFPVKFNPQGSPERARLQYTPLDQIESKEKEMAENTENSEKSKSRSSSGLVEYHGNLDEGATWGGEVASASPVDAATVAATVVANVKSDLKSIRGHLTTENGRIPVCVSFGDSGSQKCNLSAPGKSIEFSKIMIQWVGGSNPQVALSLQKMEDRQKKKIFSDLLTIPQEFWNFYLIDLLSFGVLETKKGDGDIGSFFINELRLEVSLNQTSFMSLMFQSLEVLTFGSSGERSRFEVAEPVSEVYHPSLTFLSGLKQLKEVLSKKHRAYLDSSASRFFSLPTLRNVDQLMASLHQDQKFYRTLNDDPMVFLALAIGTKKLSFYGAYIIGVYENFLKAALKSTEGPCRAVSTCRFAWQKNQIFLVRQMQKVMETMRPVEEKAQVVLDRKDISPFVEKVEARPNANKDEIDLPEVQCGSGEGCPFFYVIGEEKSSAPKIDVKEKMIVNFDYKDQFVLTALTGHGLYLWPREVMGTLPMFGELHAMMEPIGAVTLKQKSGYSSDFFAKNPELSRKYDDFESMIRQLGSSHAELKRRQKLDPITDSKDENSSKKFEENKYWKEKYRQMENGMHNSQNRMFPF